MVSVTSHWGKELLSPGSSKAHYGSARGLPQMPVCSLPARHVLMGSLTLLTFWSMFDTFFTFCQFFLRIKRGRRAALEHVCAHGINYKKEGLASNSNHCIPRLRRDNIMNAPKMKKILCLHVYLVHTSSLCVSKKASSSSQEGRPDCSRQEEGKEGGWEGQDSCGFANGYRKTEGSSRATTQHSAWSASRADTPHFSSESSAPKMSTPSRTIWGCLQSSLTRSWKE